MNASSLERDSLADCRTQRTPRGGEKKIDTLTALVALIGVQLVAIEGDDGGVELLITEGAAALRFRDLQAANSAIVARAQCQEGACHRGTVSEGRRA